MREELLAPTSPGEIFDKITILEIKKQHFSGDKLENVLYELFMLDELTKKIWFESDGDMLYILVNDLRHINRRLWKMEDDLQNWASFHQVYIANLAINIHMTNRDRARVKKQINKLLQSDLVEEKS